MSKHYCLNFSKRILIFLSLVASFFFSKTATSQSTTITTTSTAQTFISGGTIVFGVRNTNAYAVILTDLGNYCPAAHSSTYTLWYHPTVVTGLPGAITAANGWVQLPVSYTVPTTPAAGIIPIFSGIGLQIPASTIYRLALVSSVSGPYYSNTGSSPDIFSGGGTDILAQANAASPTYTGAVTGPTNTPRGFYGSLTFMPALPCTNPITPGTTTSTATAACAGTSFSLGLSGVMNGGTGLTTQWQSSATNSNFTDISGATSGTLTTSQSVSTYYRCALTCSGGTTVYSTPVQVTSPPLIPAGTFTINAALPTGGTNFQTFNDAVNYIKCGIAGPLVFNVDAASGPYNEQVIIPEIFGTSAANTITINGNGKTLSFNSTNTNERAGIKLNGADYVTISNLVITGSGSATTDYNWGVQLINNADNNAITGCTITVNAASTSTNFSGIVISGSATSAITSGSLCDNNTIIGNSVTGGYYGITLAGDATAFTSNNKLINNQVKDWYFYGIYVIGNANAVIEANDICRPFRSTVSTFNGIYFSGNSQACTITRNKIHDPFKGVLTSTSAGYGIYFTSCDAVARQENVVSNNLIYNFNGGGVQYGIYSVGSDSIRYYHNTISLEDAAYAGTSVTYGFYQTTTSKSIEIKNNIIRIKRGGAGTKYCLYFGATGTASTIESNYNDLLNESTAGINGTGYASLPAAGGFTTLANWQTGTGNDANSLATDPLFNNPAVDNFIPTASLLDNKGLAVGVVIDAAGVSRSSTSPDIGAYEFVTYTAGINVGAEALVAPSTATNGCYGTAEKVTIRIRNGSLNQHDFTINPVTVTTNVTGAAMQALTKTINTGTLASGATLNVEMVQTLDMTAIGSYLFNATTALTGDVNTANDAMPEANRSRVALSAGSAIANPPSYCITGGTPVLSATGITGYSNLQWQQSATSGAGFTNIPGAITSPYTVGMAINQNMYYLLRATCGTNTLSSAEIAVTYNNPMITSTTPATRCGDGTVNLAATGSAGTTINWYAAPTGGTALATGTSFTTPVISATTNYYAAAGSGAGIVNTGMASPVTLTSSGAGTTNFGIVFDVFTPFTLVSVVVYPISSASTPGTVTIDIINGSGTVVHTTTANVTSAPSGTQLPNIITLNFNIQPGTNYKMRPAFTGISGLLFEPSAGAPSGNYGYPYVIPGVLSINTSTLSAAPANTARNDLYYYFYNWKVSTGCESQRTAVAATVDCTVPVTLLSFKGEKAGGINKLEWHTATEINNSGFELQRSADGIRFSPLAFVPTKATGGNSTGVLIYNFDDVQPLLSTGYYRLKQIDKDNRATYSQVLIIKANNPSWLTIGGIYPNPVSRQLNIIVTNPQQQNINLIITDMAGRVITQKAVIIVAGDNKVNFDVSHLPSGSYTIMAICSNGCKEAVQKFVKQ